MALYHTTLANCVSACMNNITLYIPAAIKNAFRGDAAAFVHMLICNSPDFNIILVIYVIKIKDLCFSVL